MKKALVTGISGQDGSYLAELLLSKGYEVHGLVRRESLEDPAHRLDNIRHLVKDVRLHPASIHDHLSIYRAVNAIQPDEFYHLAAASFVDYSLNGEFLIMDYNFKSTHYILSSLLELRPQCRLFFAGSSELFGSPGVAPQDEGTRFNPKSIYGISKASSFFLVSNYRSKEALPACTGIMYNHESPRRGHQFVTRKITSGAAQVKLGRVKTLKLGNLDARRDWGYAPEYVRAMWMMLQREAPKDYVIATGRLHSVRDFLGMVFGALGLNYHDHVEVDPNLYRAAEDVPLVGDPSLIERELGWRAEKPLREIVEEMVEAELKRLTDA